MDLTTLLTDLKTSLAAELPDWQVTVEEISYPKDKLVEIVFLDFNLEAVDMTTYAFKGNLGVVLYKEFNSSYHDQIDAVETTVEWLSSLNLAKTSVGDNTPIKARVSVPSISDDGRTQYRVIQVTVPFEHIN